jgi:hypothetical protein
MLMLITRFIYLLLTLRLPPYIAASIVFTRSATTITSITTTTATIFGNNLNNYSHYHYYYYH